MSFLSVVNPVVQQYKSALCGAGLSLLVFFIASVLELKLGVSGAASLAIYSSTAIWKISLVIIGLAVVVILFITEVVSKDTVYAVVNLFSGVIGGTLGASFTVYCVTAWSQIAEGDRFLRDIAIVFIVCIVSPILIEIVHHNANLKSRGERYLAIAFCAVITFVAYAFIPWRPS